MNHFNALLCAAAVAVSMPARADAVDALRDFVREARTGRAAFTQTVTSPDGAKKKTSSGRFDFARPNRFRFAYTKPYEQLIVGDGQKVWIHDVDLQQVTTRPMSQALGATPAALLAGFGAPWNSLKPEGVLELATQSFTMRLKDSKLALGGRVTLDATDMSSSLSTLRPMGSYRFVVEGGPVPTLLLTTREGSLQLNGSGSWSGTFMRFSGEARHPSKLSIIPSLDMASPTSRKPPTICAESRPS